MLVRTGMRVTGCTCSPTGSNNELFGSTCGNTRGQPRVAAESRSQSYSGNDNIGSSGAAVVLGLTQANGQESGFTNAPSPLGELASDQVA